MKVVSLQLHEKFRHGTLAEIKACLRFINAREWYLIALDFGTTPEYPYHLQDGA